MTPILTIARTRLRLSLRQYTALLPMFAVVSSLVVLLWLRGAAPGDSSELLKLVGYAQWFAAFLVPLTMALAASTVDRRVGVEDDNARVPLSDLTRRLGEALGIFAASSLAVLPLAAAGLLILLKHHSSWVLDYATAQAPIGGLVCMFSAVFARGIVSGGKWAPATMLIAIAALLVPTLIAFSGQSGATPMLADVTGAAFTRAYVDAVSDGLPVQTSPIALMLSVFMQAALTLSALLLPAIDDLPRTGNSRVSHSRPAPTNRQRASDVPCRRRTGWSTRLWRMLPSFMRTHPVTAHVRMQMQLVGRGVGSLIVVLMLVGAILLTASQPTSLHSEPSDLLSGAVVLLLVVLLPVALSLLLAQRERASGLSSLEPMSPLSSPQRRLASSCAVAFFSVVALLVFTGYGTLTWDWAGGRAGVAQEFVAYTCRNVAGICLVSALCSRLLPPASAGRSVALGTAFASVLVLSGLGRDLFGPAIHLTELAAATLVLAIASVAAILAERESVVGLKRDWLMMLVAVTAMVCLWSYVGYTERAVLALNERNFLGDRCVGVVFASCLASMILLAFRSDDPQRTAARSARGERVWLRPAGGAALAVLVLFGAAFWSSAGLLLALDELVVAERRWSPETINLISLTSQLLLLATLHHVLAARFEVTHPGVPTLAVILFALVCLGLQTVSRQSGTMGWLPIVGPTIGLIDPRSRVWRVRESQMHVWVGFTMVAVVSVYVARSFQRRRPL